MGGPAPSKGEQRLAVSQMCYLERSELQRGRRIQMGLTNEPTGAPGKETGVSWARETTQTKEQSQAWSCDHGSSMWREYTWNSQNREEPGTLGRSWDTSNSFAPWQAYLTHTAAGAIGVGEEQPWDTLLQRLVLVTSLKCCAAAGMRRLLTAASLWNSALCVTRFSFPALIHIKALQSRHKIHIVTISSESRDATLDVQ